MLFIEFTRWRRVTIAMVVGLICCETVFGSTWNECEDKLKTLCQGIADPKIAPAIWGPKLEDCKRAKWFSLSAGCRYTLAFTEMPWVCGIEIKESCPGVRWGGYTEIVPCIAKRGSNTDASCTDIINRFIVTTPITTKEFDSFQSTFSVITPEQFNARSFNEWLNGGSPLPSSLETILAQRADPADVAVKPVGGPYRALFRIPINGLQAFAVQSVSDISLYFYDARVPSLKFTETLGWTNQEKDVPVTRETKLLDLDADGKLDLLYLDYGQGYDEGPVCDVERVHAKFWRNDHFEEHEISNDKELQGRYFGNPCTKTMPLLNHPAVLASTAVVVIDPRWTSTFQRSILTITLDNQTAHSICRLETPYFTASRVAYKDNHYQTWAQPPSGWTVALIEHSKKPGEMQFIWKSQQSCIKPGDKRSDFTAEVPKGTLYFIDSNYQACRDFAHCESVVVRKHREGS